MDKVFYSLKVEGNYKPSVASRRIMKEAQMDALISVIEGIHIELICIREIMEDRGT